MEKMNEIEKAIEVFESEKKCWERECCDCKAENKGCYLSTTDFLYAEARDVALQVLRSQLTREQNEPLTCEGCIYDGFSKSGRYLLGEENPCFGCRRNSFTSDAYRNKPSK
jgi:hypothetical protein